MIYDKNLLSSLILDALKSYRLSVKKVHPERLKQIERLQTLCFSTEYDVMLEAGINRIIQEIHQQEKRWFWRYPSQFAIILEKALSSYHELVYFSEVQDVLYEQLANNFKKKSPMPSHEKIIEEANKLLVQLKP